MISVAIVEDDEHYAVILKEYLKKYEEEYREAIDVTRFEDGDEIVEIYRSQFDIILMDNRNAFYERMEAAKKIRKR